MTEEEKIMAGVLFCPADPALKEIKRRTHNLNLEYNRTCEDETELRDRLIHEMVGEIGEGSFLQGPVWFHYGKHLLCGMCLQRCAG